MNEFSERLKELRLGCALTQKGLAENIGMHERGIQSYELADREPTLGKLIKLADFFNVSLDYLVGRSDDPKY